MKTIQPESLAVFFKELGIDNLVDSPGPGDWYHISLIDLEKAVRPESGNWNIQKDGYYLLARTTEGPDSKSDDYGQFVHPLITNKRGTIFTFTHAKFSPEDNQFFLKTIIKEGDTETENSYTISELRKIISDLPGLKAWLQRFASKIKQCFTS